MNNQKPPVLSDVISAIISSLTKGRFIADLEAMRLAMEYEKIDLLKGLPVPRLRFSNVKISMPVIMTEVLSGANATHVPVPKIVEKTLESFHSALKESKEWIGEGISRNEVEGDNDNEKLYLLKRYEGLINKIYGQDIDLVSRFKADLGMRLQNDIAVLGTTMHGIVSAPALIKQVGESTEKSLYIFLKTVIFLYIKEMVAQKKEPVEFEAARARDATKGYLDHKIVKEFIAKVRFSAENNTIEQYDRAAEIRLLVDTESIKNAGGGPDAVTRLNFNIREEGLEWVTDVFEDKEVKRLTPE